MTDITITFAALSDVGLTRSINEDAFQLTDLSTGASFDASPSNGQFQVGRRGALLTLSDGMGGACCWRSRQLDGDLVGSSHTPSGR